MKSFITISKYVTSLLVEKLENVQKGLELVNNTEVDISLPI
jgi:hypothetical protein